MVSAQGGSVLHHRHPDVEILFLTFHPQTHSHQAFVWIEGLLMVGEAGACAVQLQEPTEVLPPRCVSAISA